MPSSDIMHSAWYFFRVAFPEFLKIPEHLVQEVIETSKEIDGIKIAIPSALIALKLFRLSMQDKTDIIALIKYTEIDLTPFGLPLDKIEKYMGLIADADQEPPELFEPPFED